ncbi:50S ribosomal protein L4, partial [Nanoarchaeota archaeon]
PYGADPRAGKKCSAELSRRRRKYRGSYGHGISRVPRKILSRAGTRLNWVGAFAPGTVGGRRAHAPKASKIWTKKINIKERRKAIRSAIAATMVKTLVTEHGHRIPDAYPFAVSTDFESLSKTQDVKKALLALGFKDELIRTDNPKIRAGKSRLRGRKYRKKTGPLFVVGDDCPLQKSAKNIAGIQIVKASMLNAELLAPGCVPGRATLYTESALEKLKSLFSNEKKKAEPKKTKFQSKKPKKDKAARDKLRAKKAAKVKKAEKPAEE